MKIRLHHLGWSDTLARACDELAQPGWYPARIARETKINYTVLAPEAGEHEVVLAGKVWHDAATDAELPTVGDWVMVDPGEGSELPVIRALLPRRNRFSRKAPGRSCAEQVIGANVDMVVVVTDAGADYNLRRLERYLTLIRKSGARPLVLINKADITPPEQMAQVCAEIQALSDSAAVCPICAQRAEGYPPELRQVAPGTTLLIVGSSGVGKSTLVNSLIGEEWLETGEVNAVTGKGRHTTVARELVLLRGGGVLIDNPGIREVQMWTDAATLRAEFDDLTRLACTCRFADCSHRKDTGCAVRAALERGELAPERYEHFLHLEQEIADLERRAEKRRMTLERVTRRAIRNTMRNRGDREEQLRDLHPNRHR